MPHFIISTCDLKAARKARKKEQKEKSAENLNNGLTYTKSIRGHHAYSFTDRRERARPVGEQYED